MKKVILFTLIMFFVVSCNQVNDEKEKHFRAVRTGVILDSDGDTISICYELYPIYIKIINDSIDNDTVHYNH